MREHDNNKKAYIAYSAYEAILQECSKWERTETGTVLVGVQIPDGYIVTKALPPGPGAKRTPGSFSPDIEYVQKELEAYRFRHPGEDFLGIHHQHPGWLNHPSSGDVWQAREILNDPDYKINGRLLSIISVRHNGGIRMYPYQITTEATEFVPLYFKILNDDNSEMTTLLSQSASLKSGEVFDKKATSFWNDQPFQWYHTPTGKRRLEEDILSIQNESGVLPKVIKVRDGVVIIEARRLLMVYPPEYPLNSPRFFIQKRDLQLREIYGPSSFHPWNSTRSLNDLISSHPLRRYLNYGLMSRVFVTPFMAAIGKLKRSTISQEVKNIKQSEKEE